MRFSRERLRAWRSWVDANWALDQCPEDGPQRRALLAQVDLAQARLDDLDARLGAGEAHYRTNCGRATAQEVDG